jgi:hypothetical protein
VPAHALGEPGGLGQLLWRGRRALGFGGLLGGIDLRPTGLFRCLGHGRRQAVQQLIVDLQTTTRVEDRVGKIRDAVITQALRGVVDELGGPCVAVRRCGVSGPGRPRYLRGRVTASTCHRDKGGDAEERDP